MALSVLDIFKIGFPLCKGFKLVLNSKGISCNCGFLQAIFIA